MAIYPLLTSSIINVDVLKASSFKAGMVLVKDSNNRAIKADNQLLSGLSTREKLGRILGFSASDHDINNTIIIPDLIGSSYVDSSNQVVYNSNVEYSVPKRGLLDLQDETISKFYNPSDTTITGQKGVGVYNAPGDIFITDQFVPVLHGDYGVDGSSSDTINPGDLLTFGGGINAGKLVKVNVNSLGPDVLVVGVVEKYIVSTGLLYLRQNSYSLSFGNYISIFYDAANIVSYPRTGTTWSNLASTNYNMTLINGPVYSSANNGVMVFDGADDYATSSGFSFTNFTMEMFVNVYQLTGALAFNRILQTNSTYLTVVGSSFYGTLNALAPFDSTSGYVITSYIVPLGQYIHLTVVRNGTTYEIFVNGVSVYSASLGNATMTDLRLANGGGNENTRSSFGYLKIYNKVLTATEVLNQFNFNKSRFGV